MPRKRKIPVRHHHGIRDPLKQLEEREKKLKNVTNDPPERKDSQQLSRSFKQFKKIVDAVNSGKKLPKRLPAGREDLPKLQKSNKKKHKNEEASNISKSLKPIKQLPGEEDRDYLRRVNRITAESLKEAQYEAKYGVKVIRNSKTGEIIVQKKPRNEIDELLKKKEKERLAAKRNKGRNKKSKIEEKPKMDSKTAKELIKQVFKDEKQEKQNVQLREYQRDEIKFGEVVHAPPTISTLPRKAAKADTVPRPGKKDNLLLKSMLKTEEHKPETKSTTSKEKKQTKAVSGGVTKDALKGKRKKLPAATRDMLEKERLKLVELYRSMKKPFTVPMDK